MIKLLEMIGRLGMTLAISFAFAQSGAAETTPLHLRIFITFALLLWLFISIYEFVTEESKCQKEN